LIAEGLVRESRELTTPGSGRPGVGLVLNPEAASFIGAAIEVDYLTVVELNLAAQIVQRIQEPIGKNREPEAVLNRLVQLINQVRQTSLLGQGRARGVGLAVQGTLSLDSVVIRLPFLGWHTVDLRHYLKPHIDLPLFVDNDANAAALTEVYLGNPLQSGSLLYILMNNGVGAGIVNNNRIWRGANGTAAEIGALLLNSAQLNPFRTEQQPVLDDRVGKEKLLQQYRKRGGTAPNLDALIQDLEEGVSLAQAIVWEWGELLGWGLVAAVNLLNPERIVLGGATQSSCSLYK